MRIRPLILAGLAACLAAADPDPLDRVLGRLGLDRAGFRPDPAFLEGKAIGDHRLPMVDAWLREPLRIPLWEQALRDGLLRGKGEAGPTLQVLARCAGQRPWRALSDLSPAERWKALAARPDGLEQAVLALDPKATPPPTGSLPPALRRAATILLAATADLLDWRRIALRRLDQAQQARLHAALVEPLHPLDGDRPDAPPPAVSPADLLAANQVQDLLEQVDLRGLFAGADDLAAALALVEPDLQALAGGSAAEWRCDTALGAIRLGGDGPDGYEGRPWLLIIDTGGDDRYAGGGASAGPGMPVGILIDVAGNDRYHAAAGAPSFGAGVLGWGVLIDRAGDDRYEADGFLSQGAAQAGVGWLQDLAGDDRYQAAGGAQGFARWGAAWLADRTGDDGYRLIVLGQGCGCTNGAGLLFDAAGNDTYLADDERIVAPSPQTPKHNFNGAQGAGFGERRDPYDGRSQAGGVGILLDGAGNDRYSGGVFVQAAGFWHGIGILDDRSGDDRYRGVWYAQSSAAHFGASCLVDGAGDDDYEAVMCMTAGAANDVSASVFLDEGGNDRYHGRISCGEALNQGVAVFADLGGDDRYDGGVFGRSGDHFTAYDRTGGAVTAAVFLDLGGADTYPAGAPARDGGAWTMPAGPATGSRLLGGGEDATGTLRWGIGR